MSTRFLSEILMLELTPINNRKYEIYYIMQRTLTLLYIFDKT